MDRIEVRGMRFHAFHGCHASERQVGGVFEVDVELLIDLEGFQRSDILESTIDYLLVMETVDEEMSRPRNLIETLAADIGRRLKKQFEQVAEVIVTVRKKAPPVSYELDYVAVTVKV